MLKRVLLASVLWSSVYTSCWAADNWGLKQGVPEIKSAGPLAFGPDGILLWGDTKAAAIYAIATDDAKGDANSATIEVDQLLRKLGETLNCSADELAINDLAVNPASGNVYLSLTEGKGEKASPALVMVDKSGKLSKVSLEKAAFAKTMLPNAPEDKITGEGRRARNLRDDSITDLAYVNGKVLVSGLSSGSAPSTVRELTFPFSATDTASTLEIYHAAHGRVEDYAAIRTFVPFTVDGKPTLLAGFVCTPLVKFPIEELKNGEKTRGTTVAELGNMNRPLDMIAYQKDGQDYLLMANSARGVMKISTKDIANNTGLTEPVKGGGTAGQSFETIKDLTGVVQLDRLGDSHAVILTQNESGATSLKTIDLP